MRLNARGAGRARPSRGAGRVEFGGFELGDPRPVGLPAHDRDASVARIEVCDVGSSEGLGGGRIAREDVDEFVFVAQIRVVVGLGVVVSEIGAREEIAFVSISFDLEGLDARIGAKVGFEIAAGKLQLDGFDALFERVDGVERVDGRGFGDRAGYDRLGVRREF